MLKDQALSFLQQAELNHIYLLEPIRRGHAQVLYAQPGNIVAIEQQGGSCLILSDDPQSVQAAVDLSQWHSFAAQGAVIDWLQAHFGARVDITVFQAAYLEGRPFALDYGAVRPLTMQHADFVFQHYHSADDPAYTARIIQNGQMWGVFEQDQLAGFIGVHPEGSIGLLEILPPYRMRGYGFLLETYAVNYFLARGSIPFCHVVTDNAASLALQKKIGMQLAPKTICWLSA